MNLSEKITEILNNEFPGGADDLMREFTKVFLKRSGKDEELEFVVLLIQAQIVSMSSRIEKIEQMIEMMVEDGK